MIDKKNLVEKSNLFNSFSCNDMSLIELRFFCLYLSRLNARNPSQRTVVIPMEEFEDFFDIKVNTTLFTQKIRKIAGRTVEIRLDNKNKILTLYSQFEWAENDPRSINITCNYDIMPYIFELKKNYTTYMIGNIAKLNSVAKIRLYEICKQYEKISTIKLNIDELKQILGSQLKEFKEFKRITLEPAIKDINEYTDIQVSYEKNLSCRKVVALTFTISKKDDAPKFLPNSVENVEKPVNNPLESLYYRCNEAYNMGQLEMLYNYVENSGAKLNVNTENYIYSVYCQTKIEGNKVNNLFKYTFAIIKKQMNEYIFNVQPVQKEEPPKEKPKKEESNIDFKEWERCASKYPRRMSDEECFFVLDDFDNTIGFVFESDFDKIADGTWRKLDNRFSNGHLSPKSDLGRSLMSLKK